MAREHRSRTASAHAANSDDSTTTTRAETNLSEDAQQDEARKESFQRGFSEGRTVGHDQAAAELQPVMDRLSRSLSELASIRTRVRKAAEADLLKLAIAVARRVLHRELTLDPGSIEGLIRVALEKLESRELCRVRVHPDQEPVIRTLLARFSAAVRGTDSRSDSAVRRRIV